MLIKLIVQACIEDGQKKSPTFRTTLSLNWINLDFGANFLIGQKK